MKTVYCTHIETGNYEDKYTQIIYVGFNLNDAKESIKNYSYNFATIEYWLNGEKIKEIEI